MDNYLITIQLPVEINLSAGSNQKAIQKARKIMERFENIDIGVRTARINIGNIVDDYQAEKIEYPF